MKEMTSNYERLNSTKENTTFRKRERIETLFLPHKHGDKDTKEGSFIKDTLF